MKRLVAILSALILINVSYALDYYQIKEAYLNSFKFENLGNYKKAIEVLSPVYKNYPNSYTINLRLGWLYYLLRKYKNSIYHYTKAIKALPSSIEAKLGYTLPLLAQEKYEDVEKVCYQILNLDFYNYYGNLRLAYSLRKQKKLNLAESICKKMLYIYPTDLAFLTELLKIKEENGKIKEAKEIAKNIIILDPTNKTAINILRKKDK